MPGFLFDQPTLPLADGCDILSAHLGIRFSVSCREFTGVRRQRVDGGTTGEKKIDKQKTSAAKKKAGEKPFGEMTDKALKRYLKDLNGHNPVNLYQLVIGEVEKPLFRNVIDYAGGNRSQAAKILGINRGTLRRKLKLHNLLEE